MQKWVSLSLRGEATMADFSHRYVARVFLSLDSFNGIHKAPSSLLKHPKIVVGVEAHSADTS